MRTRRLPDATNGGELGPQGAAFLTARDSLFQAAMSETGWPHVQFRGGAPGFLKGIDHRTIGYANYRRCRQ